MSANYFWQDLWLRLWWEASDVPASFTIFLLLSGILFFYSLYVRHKYDGIGFCNDPLDVLTLIVGAVCVLFFFITILSPWVYPYVYDHSPNTPFKEELRTIDIDQGSTVWVIKRDEQHLPIDVEEHIAFGKTTDHIIIYQTFPYNETTVDQQNALLHVPINDCYTSKEEAEAFIEATSEEKK